MSYDTPFTLYFYVILLDSNALAVPVETTYSQFEPFQDLEIPPADSNQSQEGLKQSKSQSGSQSTTLHVSGSAQLLQTTL